MQKFWTVKVVHIITAASPARCGFARLNHPEDPNHLDELSVNSFMSP
jgi:hypothetical protein